MSAPPVPRAAAPSLRFPQLLGLLALAGLAAGLLAGVWGLLITERAIRPALAIEEARRTAEGDIHPHEELFSRATQTIGGVIGTALAGVLIALVVGVVFALVRHRLPARTDFGRMVVLAAIGFAVVGLLPAVKIPPNPPSVGNPATIGTRTAIYGGLLLCGIVVAMLVAALVSLLQERGAGTATTVVAGTVLGVVLVSLVVLFVPDNPDTIPSDVPAGVIWDFRLASLGQQLVLWAGLGLIGGWLLDRRGRPRPDVT